MLYKERRDRLVGSDEQEALEEAAAVDAELAAEIGATVYKVWIYCSIRDPRGRARASSSAPSSRPHASSTRSPTRGSIRGRRLCLPGIHLDAPARHRRAARDPLLRTAQHRALRPVDLEPCGSPDGVILGTADPGGTIERPTRSTASTPDA